MSKWLETIAGASAPGAARKENEAQAWAQYARQAAAALRDKTGLPEISVFGPVLGRGERAFFQGAANYARLYGGDGSYSTTGLLALGNPAFMLGALAASGIVNHRRKARAQRQASVQWRDHQRAGLIVTSQRLMLHTSGRGWSSYFYGAITEYYPILEIASLTLGFGNAAPPIQLAGPPVPAAAVLVAAAVMPDRWTQDPRLSPLLASS